MMSGRDWMMPGVGIGLHGGGQAHDAVAGHQAVGVEHEHVLVVTAPAFHEIRDVAGLAMMVFSPAAVVEPRARTEPLAQGQEGALFRDPGIRIGRVRENEIIEMVAEARRFDRFVDRLERREGPRRLLVVDRHHHRGAVWQASRAGPPARCSRPSSAKKPRSALVKASGDPRKVDGEQGDKHPLQDGRAADRHHLIHLVGAEGGQQQAAAEDKERAASRVRSFERCDDGLALLRADQRRSDCVGISRRFSGGSAGSGRLRAATDRCSGLKVSNDKAMSR